MDEQSQVGRSIGKKGELYEGKNVLMAQIGGKAKCTSQFCMDFTQPKHVWGRYRPPEVGYMLRGCVMSQEKWVTALVEHAVRTRKSEV